MIATVWNQNQAAHQQQQQPLLPQQLLSHHRQQRQRQTAQQRQQQNNNNNNTGASMKMMSSCITVLLSLVVLLQSQTCEAVRSLRIVSPLQCLTIFDPKNDDDGIMSHTNEEEDITTKADATAAVSVTSSQRRSQFLPRFQAGLRAEIETRKVWMERRKQQKLRLTAAAAAATDDEDDDAPSASTTTDWAAKAHAMDRRLRQAEARAMEMAHDTAVQHYDEETNVCRLPKPNPKPPLSSQYQFVGVINNNKSNNSKSKSSSSPAGAGGVVTWYARKKPRTAKWSVRLVHVNQRAVLKDLFDQGKVDVFAKYQPTGGKRDPDTNRILVKTEYSVRERNWKNVWNFSPKHFVTDASGMYWRERRLRPGWYTDGNTVYEATYRYRDGRNGMRIINSWTKFLNTKNSQISLTEKQALLQRIQTDAPDVVLE